MNNRFLRLTAIVVVLAMARRALAEPKRGAIPPDGMEILAPREFVVGLPMLIGMRATKRHHETTAFWSDADLASDHTGVFYFAIKCTSHTGTSVTLNPRYGEWGDGDLDGSGRHPGAYNLRRIGESHTTVLDLYQFPFLLPNPPSAPLPLGRWKLACQYRPEEWKPETSKPVVVREPTKSESAFIAAMAKQGLKGRWFPYVVTRDDVRIPAMPMPEASHRLRDYIVLLRLAVRAPEKALQRIRRGVETTDFLRPAIAELQYECALLAHGADSPPALAARRALQAMAPARLWRIDHGGNMTARFIKLRKDVPAHRKRR